MIADQTTGLVARVRAQLNLEPGRGDLTGVELRLIEEALLESAAALRALACERAGDADFAQTAEARIARLEAALRRLLACPDDHMTACEKTIGDTHPCTCGADAARAALAPAADGEPAP